MVIAASQSLASPFLGRIVELAKQIRLEEPEKAKYIFMMWGSLKESVCEAHRIECRSPTSNGSE